MKLRLLPKKWRFRLRRKGGAGSGNWGHTGRPGLVGGSGGRGGGFVAGGVGATFAHENNAIADAMLSANVVIPPTEREIELAMKTGASREEAIEQLSNEYSVGDWETASDGSRSAAKRAIILELSQRTGIPEEEVSNFIKQWAHSSNDSDMRSLALQKDAADELGIPMSKWQQTQYENVEIRARDQAKLYGEDFNAESFPNLNPLLPSNQQRALVREMYNYTQEQLKTQGDLNPGESIRLYRGVGIPDTKLVHGDHVNYQGNALESWSVSPDIANKFAKEAHGGVLIQMDVPVSNIVGTAKTGFGCLYEGEYVVVGNIPGQEAYVKESYQ